MHLVVTDGVGTVSHGILRLPYLVVFQQGSVSAHRLDSSASHGRVGKGYVDKVETVLHIGLVHVDSDIIAIIAGILHCRFVGKRQDGQCRAVAQVHTVGLISGVDAQIIVDSPAVQVLSLWQPVTHQRPYGESDTVD